MRMLIVGAGSIGAYYGVQLVRAGFDVTFLARGDSARAMAESGVTIQANEGVLFARVPIVYRVADLAPKSFDLALVTTKRADLPAIAAGVGRALRDDGVAIPLQNGLDPEEVLASEVGASRIVGGVAFVSAGRLGPARFYCHQASAVILAPFQAGDESRVKATAELLNKAFPCHFQPDLRAVRWSKMVWNGPFNAICALTDRTAGEVLQRPDLEALVRSAMDEVIAVAAAEGVVLDPAEPDRLIALTRGPAARTEPSMLQDLRAGRRTEADAIQGAVCERGSRHGVPTPLHRTLWVLVRGRERVTMDPPEV